MRLSISIITLSKKYELILDDKLNKANFCGKCINCNIDELKFKILDLIQSWPEKLINTNIVDGIKYKVSLKNDEISREYIGVNKLPGNFSEFYDLITNLQ